MLGGFRVGTLIVVRTGGSLGPFPDLSRGAILPPLYFLLQRGDASRVQRGRHTYRLLHGREPGPVSNFRNQLGQGSVGECFRGGLEALLQDVQRVVGDRFHLPNCVDEHLGAQSAVMLEQLGECGVGLENANPGRAVPGFPGHIYGPHSLGQELGDFVVGVSEGFDPGRLGNSHACVRNCGDVLRGQLSGSPGDQRQSVLARAPCTPGRGLDDLPGGDQL